MRAGAFSSTCGFLNFEPAVSVGLKLRDGTIERIPVKLIPTGAITNHTGDELSKEYHAVWSGK